MKKVLLLLCVLPSLLCAQNIANDIKEKRKSLKWFSKAQTEVKILTRAINQNQPDSVYIYEGEDKQLIDIYEIIYDEKGRIVLENHLFDENGDGKFIHRVKKENTYTEKNGLIWEESIFSILNGNTWHNYSKETYVYNKNNIVTEMYIYDYKDNNWVIDYMNVSTEFNEKGNPIVVVDSTMINGKLKEIGRFEATYNEKDQIETIVSFFRDSEKSEWLLEEKIELSYNDNGKFLLQKHYDMEDSKWEYSYKIDYIYDEKDYLKSEIETYASGFVGDEYYYHNVYSSSINNEFIISSPKSFIYPNPASDQVTVNIGDAQRGFINLISVTGSIIKQQTVQKQITTISVNSIPKGFYLLIVNTEKGRDTHRLIIK